MSSRSRSPPRSKAAGVASKLLSSGATSASSLLKTARSLSASGGASNIVAGIATETGMTTPLPMQHCLHKTVFGLDVVVATMLGLLTKRVFTQKPDPATGLYVIPVHDSLVMLFKVATILYWVSLLGSGLMLAGAGSKYANTTGPSAKVLGYAVQNPKAAAGLGLLTLVLTAGYMTCAVLSIVGLGYLTKKLWKPTLPYMTMDGLQRVPYLLLRFTHLEITFLRIAIVLQFLGLACCVCINSAGL